MPFDGNQVETPALRRAILVDALRQPMPEKFKFDFSCTYVETDCGTVGCAFGLGRFIFKFPDDWDYLDERTTGKFFGMTEDELERVFQGGICNEIYGGGPHASVAPSRVADELEKIIA